MAKPLPILERIKAAFPEGERRIHYVTLARRVFPEEQFPRAWRYSCNGGPRDATWR